ncbi:cysteine--tRNA ligase [Hellea sp.]|nr:cysteine--tRNA ligase [Hellea sp.]
MTEKPQLTLYNSLTRQKEEFKPQNPKRVTMYNCGPTVYSYAHIGNARAAVVADVLFRVLRHIYGENHVVYARNITDVDDRIIQNAKETGRPISDITEKYARIYNEDLAAIGCLPPTEQPKCTAHIDGMVAMTSDLIEKGFAYESDGHVFFDVSKYEDYGQLSGNNLESLRGGDRVGEGEVARKRNAADFVLWKPELDGVGWDAPFGKGRPGWHIECSAMAKAVLTDGTDSDTIDIHCGGVDLKFPHHENEIAQSNCAHDGAQLANYWVHNEFLNMGSEKMSKSLGNVKLIHDLLKDWDGEVIRLALLKAHYRSELIWSEDLLKESKAQLDGAYRFLDSLSIPTQSILHPSFLDDLKLDGVSSLLSSIGPGGVLAHGLENISNAAKALKSIGLLQKDPEEWFKGGLDYDALVEEYDSVRTQALAAKEVGDKAKMGEMFKRSDEIRDQFKAEGVMIESGAGGKSSWRKA